MEANDNPMNSGVKYDPSSVVLDCRLCGASIGLWAFSTASPPVEFLRLVGCSEVNVENDTPHYNENLNESRETEVSITASCTASLNEMPSNLNMTIAGGPTPAKQNFLPKISLPVIGRNLRARVSSNSEFRDHQNVKSSLHGDKDNTANTLTGQGFQIDMGLKHGKGHEDGNSDSRASNHQITFEGANISGPEIPESSTSDSVSESRPNNTQIVVLASDKHEKLPEDGASVSIADPAVGDPSCNSKVGHSSITTLHHHASSGSGATSCLHDSLLVADAVNGDQNQGTDTICSEHEDNHDGHGGVAKVQPMNNSIVPYGIGMSTYCCSFFSPFCLCSINLFIYLFIYLHMYVLCSVSASAYVCSMFASSFVK